MITIVAQNKSKAFIIFILAFGIFCIINTEMGVIGILPQIAEHYNISISKAGLLVSLFALAVAISGPVLPLLFSGFNRKGVMLGVIGLFIIGNLVSVWAPTFEIALIARIIPAFAQPVFFTLAYTVAAASVSPEEAPKAIARVLMGITTGMVIGIPITSLIANVSNLQIALLFFAIVNVVAFLAILIFIPSMPVKKRQSYGSQLRVLKKPILWVAIIAVIFIDSAMYAVYSFFAEYFESVTHMSGGMITLMLILFGFMGIVGNLIAGKLLSTNALKTLFVYPLVFAVMYLLLYLLGTLSVPMIILTAFWGVLFSFGFNATQYLIASSAPEAPEFSNGLFVSFANLGVMLGTMVGGAFISGFGPHQVIWSGILFLALGLIAVLIFIPMARRKRVTA